MEYFITGSTFAEQRGCHMNDCVYTLQVLGVVREEGRHFNDLQSRSIRKDSLQFGSRTGGSANTVSLCQKLSYDVWSNETSSTGDLLDRCGEEKVVCKNKSTHENQLWHSRWVSTSLDAADALNGFICLQGWVNKQGLGNLARIRSQTGRDGRLRASDWAQYLCSNIIAFTRIA